MSDDTNTYSAFVSAETIITVYGDSRSDAREYLDQHVKTGQLGELQIHALTKIDND